MVSIDTRPRRYLKKCRPSLEVGGNSVEIDKHVAGIVGTEAHINYNSSWKARLFELLLHSFELLACFLSPQNLLFAAKFNSESDEIRVGLPA